MKRLSLLVPTLAVLAACQGPTDAALPVTSRQAILGGSPSPSDTNVFFLNIFANTGGGGLCSATLINSRTLITAAHCVDPSLQGATSLTITASNAATNNDATQSNTYAVIETRMHPQWDSNSLTNDLAMVLLSRAPSGVTPKAWNTASLNALGGAPLRAAGYGTIGNDVGSGIKRTVDLTIRQLVANKILLGDLSSKGICHGDSGGPSFHTFPDGVERIIGVHSFTSGEDCVNGGDTRVDAYAQFVQNWMGEKEAPTCARDTRCVPGCTPVDFDCLCAADGQCSSQCPDLSADPDCPVNCGTDGICSTVPCPVKDTDCLEEGQLCSSMTQCVNRKCISDPQHLVPYCSRPCSGAGVCPTGFECDTASGNVCRLIPLPFVAYGNECVPGESWCGLGNVCNGRTAASMVCTRECQSSTDCPKDNTCVVALDSSRICQGPPKPPILVPLVSGELPASSSCASTSGLNALALLLVMVLLRARTRG